MDTKYQEQVTPKKMENRKFFCILHFWRHLTSSTIQYDKIEKESNI